MNTQLVKENDKITKHALGLKESIRYLEKIINTFNIERNKIIK